MFYSVLRLVLIIAFILLIANLQWIGEVTGFTEILKEKGALTGNIFSDTVTVILFVFVFIPLLLATPLFLAGICLVIDALVDNFRISREMKREKMKKGL